MGLDDIGDLGFQQRVGILPYSGTYMVSRPEKVAQETTVNPFSMCKSSNGVDSLYVTCCDPLVSLSHNFEFKSSSMDSHHQVAISSFNSDVMESQGISSSSHLVHYSSSPNLADQAPQYPCFGNGSFSEMLSSLCLPECDQIANAGGFPDYPSNKKGMKKTTNAPMLVDQGVINQGDLTASSMGVRKLAHNGKKRKKVPENHAEDIHSQFDSVPYVEKEQLKDVSMEPTEGLKGQDEKKPKNKRNVASDICDKLNTKQIKDNSKEGDAPKEDYFHVRARRGQATNSHSLAERVRREKISERMKLLQDLVPGCDKINGKALMLEEIINYVQTLQRQVEFLSMKLSTVNPELNIDIERILRRDILHSHGSSSAASASATLGFNPEMSYSHSQCQSHLTPRANIHASQSTDPNLPPMSQLPGVWDDELGSVLQMGLVSNTTLSSSELNGHMKLEL